MKGDLRVTGHFQIEMHGHQRGVGEKTRLGVFESVGDHAELEFGHAELKSRRYDASTENR